jgi:phage baseplate assembly protein W
MSIQSSSKFKFKSSGISINTINKTVDTLTSSVIFTEPNIGIKTPMQLGTDEIFSMHNNIENQLADNLRNLILTNFGERLGLYDFGANLRELLTEYPNKSDFDTEAANRITRAVNKWMPFVSLTNFSSTVNEAKNHSLGIAAITITINYVIPQINSQEKEIKVNLFVI